MSNEVRYELESGLHEALVERKIKIILIKFASDSDFSFLPQSLELLKSHRVLKWKADKSLSYNSRFWKNLLYLMPAKVVKPCRDESAESFPFFFFKILNFRNLNKRKNYDILVNESVPL